jgi:hypothetical protein
MLKFSGCSCLSSGRNLKKIAEAIFPGLGRQHSPKPTAKALAKIAYPAEALIGSVHQPLRFSQPSPKLKSWESQFHFTQGVGSEGVKRR